jgi:hypothetical protein
VSRLRRIKTALPGVVVLTVALVVIPFSAYPWGPAGHRIASRIAENHLSDKAARAVKALLGPDSLAEVSTWADEIRADPQWKNTAPWHYVNIADGETYARSKKDPRGDVISKMRYFEKVLRDPRAGHADKVAALKFLVHFVADVHQPLHVGRQSDRGGNEITVYWFGRRTDLHAVWDSQMVDSEKLSFSEFAKFIDDATDKQVKAWQKSDYLDWVKESMELRPRVYDIGTKRLGYAYAYKNMPVVKLRLEQAGVRLAGLLNSVFR